MIVWVLLLSEIFILLITSRYIFQSLFFIIFGITHNQKFSFMILSGIFFPGTVLHELSHLIVAELLRVRTHGVEFTPEYKNGNLKMGSVSMQQSDPMRSLLIGAAPLLVGVSVLLGIIWVLLSTQTVHQTFSSWYAFFVTAATIYIVFVISNTMFSSKKDMDHAWIVLVFFVAFILILYLLGLNPQNLAYDLFSQNFLINSAWKVVSLLSIPILINLAVLFVAHFIGKKTVHKY